MIKNGRYNKNCAIQSVKFSTYLSNQITAFKSKWFVGSSRSNKVGSKYKALAKETLILQPPEKFLVALSCQTFTHSKICSK